jgi:hypothetical protein
VLNKANADIKNTIILFILSQSFYCTVDPATFEPETPEVNDTDGDSDENVVTLNAGKVAENVLLETETGACDARLSVEEVVQG